MEFVGSIHKKYVKQRQEERKSERDQFIQDAAKLIFGILHLKLDLAASTDDYSRAAVLSIDSAKKLASSLFPDLSEKELQEQWNKFVEGN